MKRRAAILLTITVLASVSAFAFPEDPDRRNYVSTESEELVVGLTPVDQAITLAQTLDGKPLLVVASNEESIEAIDLSSHGADIGIDLFDVYSDFGPERLADLTAQDDSSGPRTFLYSELASAAGSTDRHLASGTNFPEHAEETSSSSVFLFPKFGAASPPVTTVSLRPGVLLDYEVELCARFDRDIMSVDDFDMATKGFFLCADFTDRATLIRMIDPFNFGSGSGFSDAKSGPDFFPTGPFLVIPQDWAAFVNPQRITTHLDDELRQDARGSEMILDFRQLIEKALDDTSSSRFLYRGDQYRLIENGRLERGQSLMSGTPEGVIFMPPSPLQFVRGLVRYAAGGFLAEPNPYDSIISSFLAEEESAQRFLELGDVVNYASSSLGQISITVVDP